MDCLFSLFVVRMVLNPTRHRDSWYQERGEACLLVSPRATLSINAADINTSSWQPRSFIHIMTASIDVVLVADRSCWYLPDHLGSHTKSFRWSVMWSTFIPHARRVQNYTLGLASTLPFNIMLINSFYLQKCDKGMDLQSKELGSISQWPWCLISAIDSRRWGAPSC